MTGESPITLYSSAPGLTSLSFPAYLYQQFSDDSDLQAFVEALNNFGQEYLNWFCQVILPVYTNPNIVGFLLDWVGTNIYGLTRPQLPVSGALQPLGPLNTWFLNTIPLNTSESVGSVVYSPVPDDIYKRCLTWNTYLGDGKTFTARWLKRRIMRFLYGPDGTDTQFTSTSPQVSVSFGTGNNVTITLIAFKATLGYSSVLNTFTLATMTLNGYYISKAPLNSLPFGPILKAAIDNGVLALPFEYNYTVVVQ